MENIAKRTPVADLPRLKRVCNHPKALSDFEERKSVLQFEKNETLTSDTESELDEKVDENNEWWKPICKGVQVDLLSGKMLILFSILNECEARGEKLLVFSGCLSTLNVIEHFLAKKYEERRKTARNSIGLKGIWTRDVDYLRLDGTSNVEKRKRDITEFNKETNKRARYIQFFFSIDLFWINSIVAFRLFLISSKAGGLGINLMAANRVVVFDASWNPSDDVKFS